MDFVRVAKIDFNLLVKLRKQFILTHCVLILRIFYLPTRATSLTHSTTAIRASISILFRLGNKYIALSKSRGQSHSSNLQVEFMPLQITKTETTRKVSRMAVSRKFFSRLSYFCTHINKPEKSD